MFLRDLQEFEQVQRFLQDPGGLWNVQVRADSGRFLSITARARAIEIIHTMTDQRSHSAYMEELEPLLDSLYLHARRASSRADAAGDLVQEAVMIGWREFPHFRAGTNFRAWIFRILVITVWNDNKRLARERNREESTEHIDLVAASEAENCWYELLQDGDRLSELLEERLVKALDALGAEARQCLLLRMLEGFTYREIADMLRLPAGTVMSHVHRARENLRERLAQLAIERGYSQEPRP